MTNALNGCLWMKKKKNCECFLPNFLEIDYYFKSGCLIKRKPL